MSDEVVIEINADGRLVCRELMVSCKPPGRVEWRSDGTMDGAYIALFMAGQTVTPELISDLIDTYEFAERTTGQKLVIGTG